ncbi:MAG: hypothetical protein A2521_04355 [Deltaproteobacteria bacterium RIFOXYD12_FULL_57_12]|nr:MAG: hypothetical protein A2521_04355 [Deltaproteobacteria bacterium RIFOXYD12_FULL_57_12]
MAQRYDKPTRKRFRKLTAIAHERELAGALQKLHDQFDAWQARKIDAFELNDRIHLFHQKTARELWKMYDNTVDEDLLVSRALKLGLLTEDEIGEDLIEQLGPMIGFWQDGNLDEK